MKFMTDEDKKLVEIVKEKLSKLKDVSEFTFESHVDVMSDLLNLIHRQNLVIEKLVERRDESIMDECDYWPNVRDLQNKLNQELQDIMRGGK